MRIAERLAQIEILLTEKKEMAAQKDLLSTVIVFELATMAAFTIKELITSLKISPLNFPNLFGLTVIAALPFYTFVAFVQASVRERALTKEINDIFREKLRK
jgi:hypothetical protein